MRAGAYVRVSSLERFEPGLDADTQRRRLEDHIAASGWELDEVYQDSGPLTGLRQRPGLQAALAAAGRLDRLVVVRVDRLGARARPVAKVLARLQDAGCELVSLDEQFDTGTSSGEAVRPVLEGLARAQAPPAMPQGWTADLLRRRGVGPRTAIDVGAADGTPALYEAFPDAHLVLIEPLREFAPALEALAAEREAEYVPVAVGADEGEVTLHVMDNLLVTSTLRGSMGGTPRQVRQTTLDALMEERRWPTPYCLKIDVEGYEPAVIDGARELLRSCSLVIVEVAVASPFEHRPGSADVIALMDSHGFRVTDVIDGFRTLFGVFADLVFEPARRPA